MKDLNNSDEKLVIDYPCDWDFRLIGFDQESIQKAVTEILPDSPYEIEPGNESAGGKYVSMILIKQVSSDDERTGLYEKLKNHSAIKMVL